MDRPEIIAVKLGYNPNSSSIGMMVKIFLVSALAVNILIGFINIMVRTKFRGTHKKEATG